MTNLHAIAEQLRQGETVSFRPRGHSMDPHIRSGQLVTVRPAGEGEMLRPGMIVLAAVRGKMYLHFVRAVHKNHDRVLIGPAHHVNGWTTRDKVAGIFVKAGR